VRPGLAIYGLSPIANPSLFLKPVMSLRSETVKYHFVRQGEGVSYNHTWKADRDSIVAVIPIGYADGYHRLLSNKAHVLFRGQRVPLVGNVCMDYVMVDLTNVIKNEVADSMKPEAVTLFGQDEMGNEISAAELAQKAQTIAWEILTSVGERVPREVEETAGKGTKP
jgi:alanine racemase